MKDFMMLFGFSIGVVTGALLYKYSSCTKQTVDKTEKAMIGGMKKLEEKSKKDEKTSQ